MAQVPITPQVLVLQDAATRLQVVLEADQPADAYQALVALDLSAFQQGSVHHDWGRPRRSRPGAMRSGGPSSASGPS
ncbi:MAG: hypothetical protein ACRDTA_24760, partial [Pseudonocardiaceae bacterium]